MIMEFHEVRFPIALSRGSVGGPERRTEIVTLVNGFEQRNSPWAHSRRRYDAGMALRSEADLEALIAFFEARRGQLCGFRWKDWTDYRSSAAPADPGPFDQTIGMGGGERRVFALQKTYASGEESYVRPITKPVPGTVVVALDGVPQADVAVDAATGLVTFAVPPAAGVPVTAGFEFDVPVRFDTDRLQISLAALGAGEVPSVPVVEVRV